MCTTSDELMPCWSQQEFETIDLGDKRLTQRLIDVAEELSASPQSAINAACGDWAGAKAAYRLFDNEKVTAETILSPHFQRTVESVTVKPIFMSSLLKHKPPLSSFERLRIKTLMMRRDNSVLWFKVNPLPVNNGLRCPLAAANLPEKLLLAFILPQRRCFPLIGDRHYTRKSYRLLT